MKVQRATIVKLNPSSENSGRQAGSIAGNDHVQDRQSTEFIRHFETGGWLAGVAGHVKHADPRAAS
jgi:hypothetical protein